MKGKNEERANQGCYHKVLYGQTFGKGFDQTFGQTGDHGIEMSSMWETIGKH